jgi:hypothetical protein
MGTMSKPEAKVKLGLGVFHDDKAKNESTFIEVENAGDTEIGEIHLEFVYDFEIPEVQSEEFGIRVEEIARKYHFGSSEAGPLPPRRKRPFYLPGEFVQRIKSVVEALSPERYRIEITMDGKTETAISGRDFADFLLRRLELGIKPSFGEEQNGQFNLWNSGGTAELLRYLQEKSDDIEKVVIPQHPFITVYDRNNRQQAERVEAGLVVHWLNGKWTIVPNQQDAEAVLNDGILNRMKIKIELGR